MLGFVLAGGGARGAYEAGVLRYVYTTMPRRYGVRPDPDLISGTSVGALNGAWVAAGGADGARAVWEFWQNVQVEQVFTFSWADLARRPSRWLERSTELGQGVGLFDPSPLYRLMRDEVPWAALHSRIAGGALRALMVSATDVGSGRTRIFTEGDVPLRRSATSAGIRTSIGAEHCLASAAIPFVFPAIRLDGRYYLDGALRQNTPLSPAVEAGVDRALVVGVKRLRGEEEGPNASPGPLFLAGKALNALMLDPIEENIRRIDALNGLLAWGSAAYPGFLEKLGKEFRPYHIVRYVFLRPSDDLGRIAAEVFRASADRLPWATRRLLGVIAGGEHANEADLMSYLFFDRAFTAPLEDLGYRDAAARGDEIAALFQAPT
jgi:NTE family protein